MSYNSRGMQKKSQDQYSQEQREEQEKAKLQSNMVPVDYSKFIANENPVYGPVQYTDTTAPISFTGANENKDIMSEGKGTSTDGDKTSTEGSTTPAIAKTYEAWLSSMEKNKQNAYGKAEMDYDKAVLDAEQRYQKSLSNYGATKEQLADAGLDNSGYAKYLDDRAYATRSSEILAAQAGKAEAERAADTAYNDEYTQYLLSKTEQEETAKTAYQDLADYGASWSERLDSLNNAKTSGSIGGEELNKLYSQLFDDIEMDYIGGSFFETSDGDKMTMAEANKKIKQLEAAGMPADVVAQIRGEYANKYSVRTNGNFYIDVGSFESKDAGDKIFVKTADGSELKVEKGEETTRKDVLEAAKAASSYTDKVVFVFLYDNTIYAYDRNENKAFSIDKRNSNEGKSKLLSELAKLQSIR